MREYRSCHKLIHSALARINSTHLHLALHQIQKLWEVDRAVAIGIDFIDHVLKLSFCGVLAQ